MIHITNNRRAWFGISAAAVAVSVLASVFLGFNPGLDFTGGSRWQVQFEEDNVPTKEELVQFFDGRSEMTQGAQIQTAEAGQFLITIEELEDAQLQTIKAELGTAVGSFEEISYRKVDSSIGKSFQRKSVIAILAALGAIILVIAIAFRNVPKSIGAWKFGGVAILALFHDIIIILGIFAVLTSVTGLELDLQFITALLATLGFSVNDTIVILDRVRENIGRIKGNIPFSEIIETSVQQTLVRSINTSISTLLPLLGLLFLGAESIFYFVLALVLGIIVGTYSSIFLAAPLLVSLKKD